jgi:hypothetical protein
MVANGRTVNLNFQLACCSSTCRDQEIQISVLEDFGDEPFSFWELMRLYPEYEYLFKALRRAKVSVENFECHSIEGCVICGLLTTDECLIDFRNLHGLLASVQDPNRKTSEASVDNSNASAEEFERLLAEFDTPFEDLETKPEKKKPDKKKRPNMETPEAPATANQLKDDAPIVEPDREELFRDFSGHKDYEMVMDMLDRSITHNSDQPSAEGIYMSSVDY